jgi:hypothetical protein
LNSQSSRVEVCLANSLKTPNRFASRKIFTVDGTNFKKTFSVNG